jgi:hypothetical protein
MLGNCKNTLGMIYFARFEQRQMLFSPFSRRAKDDHAAFGARTIWLSGGL